MFVKAMVLQTFSINVYQSNGFINVLFKCLSNQWFYKHILLNVCQSNGFINVLYKCLSKQWFYKRTI